MNFTIGTGFSAFKKSFYSKSGDFSLYDCGDINLLKVVLDGLKVNYVARWKIRLPFFYPNFLWRAWRMAQRLRHPAKLPSISTKAHVLIVDLSGRSETSRDGIPVSFYFDRLTGQLERGEYIHIIENAVSDTYPHDIDLRKHAGLRFKPLSPYERNLRSQLLESYARIKRSGRFNPDELKNIRIAIQSFFSQFKLWNEVLGTLPSLRVALVQQHYHHEGLLLALRIHNIRSYEIQHGLIAPSDIFYVFPKAVSAIREKALFPDKILVYGEYWKRVLLKGGEFHPDDIVVLGDFRAKEASVLTDQSIRDFCAGNKVILISSQTFMHTYYCEYAQQLARLLALNYSDWRILLKLHPNEKEDHYSSLACHKNLMVTKANLNQLFKVSVIHISVFSTTLYDALGYRLLNLSLQLPGFEDYTNDIIRDRVALSLGKEDDPVDVFLKTGMTTQQMDPLDIYDSFARHHPLLHYLLQN